MKKTPKTLNIIVAAAATTWIFRILNAASGIITLPLILLSLSKNEYGLWVLIGQSLRFLAMSDIGIANSIGRFIARYRGEEDHKSIQMVINTSLVLSCVFGLTVTALTLVISPWINVLLGIAPEYAETGRKVFIISGLSLALMFPTRIGMGILTGYQYYGPHGIGKISKSLLFLLGIVLLASLNKLDIIALAIVSGISVLFGQGLLFYVAWKMTRPWQISPAYFSWKMAKNIFSLGTSALLVSLSKLFYNQGLGIALGHIAGLSAVAIYGVASAIVMYLEPIIGAIGSAMPTLASEFQARGKIAKLKKVANTTMLVTFGLTVGAISCLFIYSEPILHLLLIKTAWSSEDFTKINYTVMIMSFGVAFWLPQLVSRSILQAVGLHWSVTYAVFTSSIFSFIIGIIAMRSGLGVYGAALGFCLELLIEGLILFPRLLCRFIQESQIEMFLKAYLPGIFVAIISLSIAFTASIVLPPVDFINLSIGIGFSLFCAIAVLITLSGQKELLLNILQKRFFKT